MAIYKPAAAPGCWGSKYQDGEKECDQCRYNDTCRAAMLERVVNPSSEVRSNVNLPMVRSNYAPPPPVAPPSRYVYPQVPSPPPPPPMRMANPVIPLPPRPYVAPPVTQVPRAGTPSVPQQTQAQPAYYQTGTGYSIPDHRNPNPLVPMHRPGAPAPAYYFTQYPGESVTTRVIKNVLLRGLEAIFHELFQFFRHWTWPPGSLP